MAFFPNIGSAWVKNQKEKSRNIMQFLGGGMICSKSITLLSSSFLLAAISSGFYSDAMGIAFQEVTSSAGIAHISPSYGVSWGDLNGDGWPDAWVGNHSSTPSLYLNNRDGTFSDIVQTVWGQNGIPDNADTHGAAWADFDNDGDQDILELVGAGQGVGTGSNHLFVNEGGQFSEQAEGYGLTYPLGRGRTPTWFDWNKDGRLDVFLGNWPRPDGQAASAVFSQREGIFINDNDALGILTLGGIRFSHLAYLTDQNIPSLLVAGGPYPDSIYRMDTVPFQDIRGLLGFPTVFGVWDAAVADLNGDLALDFYLARVGFASAAEQTDTNTINATLGVNSDEKGFSFTTSGVVSFAIEPPAKIQPSSIFIGAQGWHPQDRLFTLSPADNSVTGLFSHTPGSANGVFIEFIPSSSQWNVFVSSDAALRLNLEIHADQPVAVVTPIGFQNSDGKLKDQLLVKQGPAFVNVADNVGLGDPTACESVVSADFDNDMDVDLYLVCRGTVTNLHNILYENQGNGTFQPVLNAGGAEGSSLGRGDSAVTADFDRDGFIDIFVTNNIGPHQLFRNIGNGNHWLEMDLEGVITNRDGIGARILATAGGMTQLREQAGGMHRFSQNHQRVHFGLGSNTRVDELVIEWPSGLVQWLDNVPADKLLHIIEPTINLVDTDGDGLSDWFETTILGTNPTNVDSDNDGLADGAGGVVSLSAYLAGVDIDGDGFVDGEQDLGTDPASSDSDGDGISDGDEVALYGIDPTVSNVGDVGPRGNPNGMIDLGDLLVLTRLVTGEIQPIAPESILGDINSDSQLNAADVLLLQQSVLSGAAP